MADTATDPVTFDLSTVFRTIAATIPDHEVLVWRGRRFSYAQLAARVDGVANYLASQGLGAHAERPELAGHESGQDHIGLYLRNGNEYLESMIAGYHARVAPFNVSYRYVEEELLYLLTDSRAAALVVNPLPDIVAGVWNFGPQGLERASGAGTLEFADGDGTATLTAFEQGPPAIAGTEGAFMRVPAFYDSANGYNLTMPTQPVPPEGYINRYSMAWDILLPWDVNWMPFFNSSPDGGNDADFYVNDAGALGIGALGYSADGLIQPDTWHRIVFAANLAAGRVTIYIDGSPVHARTGASLANGRFALFSSLDEGPDLRLFNEGDSSGDYTHEVLVKCFAFISRELTPAEAVVLGGPTAAGITLPQPVTPITIGPATIAGATITFSWTGGNGPFQVQKKGSLSASSWDNVGGPTTARVVTDGATGPAAFYRVIEP